MAMQVGSAGGDDEPMVEVNMTPMIDVMLVLLILFIITIPIQTHAVKLNMPTPSNVQPLKEPDVKRIDVDFDGSELSVANTLTTAGFQSVVAGPPKTALESEPRCGFEIMALTRPAWSHTCRPIWLVT